MDGFLSQAVIYLLAAVIAVPVAARLGLGSVLGYLAAGIVIGPIIGLVGSETKDLQHFAEFGVVMMLFVIGLELAPRTLWDMRHKLLGLGGLQVLGTMGVITWIAVAMGLAWQTALAIGMVLALSSTAIVLQTLTEKGLMRTAEGRSSFSVLLTQDVAVIPMLALLPLLALPELSATISHSDGHGARHNMLAGLPGWGHPQRDLGDYYCRHLCNAADFQNDSQHRIARDVHSHHIADRCGHCLWHVACGAIAGLGHVSRRCGIGQLRLSPRIRKCRRAVQRAIVRTIFHHGRRRINFNTFAAQPVLILGLTIGLIVIKAAILFGLAVIFKIKGRSRWLFTLSLAQAGEFGFVLLAFSTQQHVIPTPLAEQLLLVVALTMLITPLLFILYDKISAAQAHTTSDRADDTIDSHGPVIIAGMGRFGQIVNRLVRNSGFETVVLDNNPKSIELMRRFGIKGFFGDPTRPEILTAAGLKAAKILVVAVDDTDAAIRLVEHARREREDLHIIARATDREQVYRLYAAGANDIVREMFDSSLRAGRYVLENVGLTEYEAAEAEKTFYKHDRYALSELAKLWQPDVPTGKNEAYINRAKELEQELESALLEARSPLEGTGPDDTA